MKLLGTIEHWDSYDNKIISLEVQQHYYSFGGNYRDGNRVAIQLFSEEHGPYASFSVNIPDIRLEEDEFVLNHDNNSKLEETMMKSDLFEDTGKKANYGFVKDRPIWKVKQQNK